MRSGDGQAAAQARDLGQQVGAVQLPGGGKPLGVVGRDGGGVDDLGAVGNVGGGVAENRLYAVLAQPSGIAGCRAVRARHRRAERGGDQRQAAHPGAADADEVQAAAGPIWASAAGVVGV